MSTDPWDEFYGTVKPIQELCIAYVKNSDKPVTPYELVLYLAEVRRVPLIDAHAALGDFLTSQDAVRLDSDGTLFYSWVSDWTLTPEEFKSHWIDLFSD